MTDSSSFSTPVVFYPSAEYNFPKPMSVTSGVITLSFHQQLSHMMFLKWGFRLKTKCENAK